MDINGQSLESSSDPAITQNIQNQAHMSNQDLANSYSGAAAGRGLLNAPNNFNSTLNYGDQATSDAIKKRYMPNYDRQEKQLSLDNIKNAQQDHIRNLQTATAAAGQEVEQNKQKALLKNQIEQANKKARGAVLGTVLGIVGGVVAGVYSGGTGAAAGYAGGQAAGQAIGSS